MHVSTTSLFQVQCKMGGVHQAGGGPPFYHCSGLRRISLLINPGMDPDVPVTVFALNLVCELLLQTF